MGLPRMATRRWMVAVGVFAIITGGTVLAKRQGVYRVRAEFHAQQEQVAARRLRHWAHEAIQLSGRPRADEQRQLAESMEGYSRDRVGYHAGLKVKYQCAARYPWLPIAPGPPAPDGVKAPLYFTGDSCDRGQDLKASRMRSPKEGPRLAA
jgi:hypothetical protein